MNFMMVNMILLSNIDSAELLKCLVLMQKS